MLHLKQTIVDINTTQAALARYLGVSAGTVSLICTANHWPKNHGGKAVLKERICSFLLQHGAASAQLLMAFNEVPTEARANAPQSAEVGATKAVPTTNSDPQTKTLQPEDIAMLLRKHTISREARRHYKIARDPFTDEMGCEADVFVTDEIRNVRSAIRMTAKHGGMLAVVSESGGGKSTLRQDLIEWIQTNDEPITVIEPYVIGMEDSAAKGKALRAADITGAVIRAVSPGMSLRLSLQDRAAQMHSALKASAQIGRKHVLIIEEAHALATPTLKHLKRFYELQDGFKKLLSIILIGQTELEWKLSEQNPEVREVVQRCGVVHLPAIDNHVEAYLRHKLKRVDLDFDALIALDAVDEIRNRLRHSFTTGGRGRREVETSSLCYPLAINNLVSAALNEGVKIGAPKVNAALIAAAAKSN